MPRQKKNLPKGALKNLEKTLLYSKQGVFYNSTPIDRRIHDESSFTTAGLTAIKQQPKNKFPTKNGLQNKNTTSKNNRKNYLNFEKLSPLTLPSLDAKTIFTKAPFIQYEQLQVDKAVSENSNGF